ncbi:MAG: hypothetical protein HC835_22140 [Oscillatoriales cyanobacterium RM2_1_1]|nr:hypothetical protein [Oscillatoriales cyanobacterium RM2_1_1]
MDVTSKVPHIILNIEVKEVRKSPPAPFTTSTLQQAAGSQLNFNTKTTMSLAQKLYESGFITYIRTDSCILSEDFRSAPQGYLQQYNPENIPDKPTQHRNRSSAQEGHEAIRPTDVKNTPDVLRLKMEGQEFKLYELIWNRALASQCKPALMERSLVKVAAGEWQFLLKGNRILQEGYVKYWEGLGEEILLPELSIGQELDLEKVRWSKHQTEPPKRFTEASNACSNDCSAS